MSNLSTPFLYCELAKPTPQSIVLFNSLLHEIEMFSNPAFCLKRYDQALKRIRRGLFVHTPPHFIQQRRHHMA